MIVTSPKADIIIRNEHAAKTCLLSMGPRTRETIQFLTAHPPALQVSRIGEGWERPPMDS